VYAATAVLIEGATIGFLFVNDSAQIGLVLALITLALFSLVVVRGVIRGVDAACNCFGSDGTTLGWTHVWRNVMLASVAAIGAGAASTSTMPSEIASTAYATPIVLSLITAALFVVWDDITYLVRGSQPT
jgi:hypothetical protein